MAPELTAEQRRAIDRRESSLLVRAGAGTGKTTVLVERFAQAVVSDGAAVDSILAITFTDKAAAQLKARVRARFVELRRRQEARDAEGAWISTIHGFCSRVLRAHALTAGLDPEYRVLGELEAERIGLDAFDRALEGFLGAGADPGRLEMAAAYTPDRLRDMVRTAYSRLRSQGQRRPALPQLDPPPGGPDPARLEAAARAALAELGACGDGAQVATAIERLERCCENLRRLGDADPGEVADYELKGNARALQSDKCQEYERARAAYAAWCVARRNQRDHVLLRDLLGLYGEQYDTLKGRRSGLDFEDLQLIARDLLEEHTGLRDQYAGRFSHVMVDEFQDTNRLQNRILELIERDNLFRVGDENQSIYGFRNADVDVFRYHHERAAAAGGAESITVNFRSRGELLDAVNLTFGRIWGKRFEPLREAEPGREERPRVDPCVELLVVDKERGRWEERFAEDQEPFGQALRSIPAWRACEARLLARRVEELVRDGGWAYGDVVMLLRATTNMGAYERALEERGVPTHVVGGRGYWSQQQVGDLRHWLSALANPLDELALYSVLASPLVGASLDAVALVGLTSRRLGRDVWWTLREACAPDGDGSDGLADELPEADRRRIGRFVELFAAERGDASRLSLETLIDRAVTETGYDRHVLALPHGDRRMANVRKLMRMAREYDAEEGRDLRGFIDFVAERDLIQEREAEAPLEAEEVSAVRIMTVHRAKGLEFPVVCVADLGKEGREDYGALRLSDDGRLGLRLAKLGGGSVNTAELERIRQDQRLADEEEEKRVFYVAVTRAREHLVLSGATDLVKRPAEQPLREPMRWLWRGLCAGLPDAEARGEVVDDYAGRDVRVRFEVCTPDTVDELLPPRDRAPDRPEPVPQPVAPVQAPLELAAVPAPRALPVTRLSYSALESYKACAYRFYLERVLRLSAGEALRLAEAGGGGGSTVDGAGGREPRASDELPAVLRGEVVHELLERLDLRRAVVPRAAEVEELIERHGAPVRREEVEDIRALVEGFVGSELRERLGGARRVRTELPFVFTLAPDGVDGRSVLVNGVVDVHALEDDRTLILDYKSDRLDGREPADVFGQQYGTQRLVYALAGLRAGAERVEVAHAFLERPEEPVAAEFEAASAAELEADLLDVAAGATQSRFEPTDDPHRELCVDCPGQPALCSWPPERTLAER